MVGPATFEGAAALEVFTLEETPHAGSRLTRTTGHDRSVVRNSAMPSANGHFDRCKGTSIMHVCGLHNLGRKTLRSGKSVVMPRHAVWGEEGVVRRRLNIGAGNGI